MKLTTRSLNGAEATLGGSLGVFPFVFIQECARGARDIWNVAEPRSVSRGPSPFPKSVADIHELSLPTSECRRQNNDYSWTRDLDDRSYPATIEPFREYSKEFASRAFVRRDREVDFSHGRTAFIWKRFQSMPSC